MRSMLRSVIVVCTLTILSAAASAQNNDSTNVASERVLQTLLGSWTGTGTLFGMHAEFAMQWESVLQNRFIRLTFENKIIGHGEKPRIMNAQAFYQEAGSGEFSGTWFDSRGMVLPLRASVTDSTLETHWGSAETEEGRTVYKIVSETQIDVTDFVLKDGEWKQFGQAMYSLD